jgi:hypothetical protein
MHMQVPSSQQPSDSFAGREYGEYKNKAPARRANNFKISVSFQREIHAALSVHTFFACASKRLNVLRNSQRRATLSLSLTHKSRTENRQHTQHVTSSFCSTDTLLCWWAAAGAMKLVAWLPDCLSLSCFLLLCRRASLILSLVLTRRVSHQTPESFLMRERITTSAAL